MEKIIDKLLIEFLIPSFLMASCILLTADIVLENRFDIRSMNISSSFENSILFIGLILLSYLFNTSAGSVMNLFFRAILWGKTREYIIYRRLNLLDESELHPLKINWAKYIH